jgi:hypothetical protein
MHLMISTMVAFTILLSGGAAAQQAIYDDSSDQEEVPRASPRIPVVVGALKPLDMPKHAAPPIKKEAAKPLDPETEKLFREFNNELLFRDFAAWRKAHPQ